MLLSLLNVYRLCNGLSIKFYNLSSAFTDRSGAYRQDQAGTTTRRILQICDSSNDVPGEIEALLRAEFAKMARHG
jgi:hypothetical protein